MTEGMTWRRRGLLALAALVLAFGFLWAMELMQGGGRWYSVNQRYREQTDALLHGRLAVHGTPVGLTHDLTWSEGGVHQVWGLGVPLWRLPWEALARVAGNQGFPDRMAFGLALALAWYLVLRALVAGPGGFMREGWLVRWAAAAALMWFPAFVTLCRARFDIYEEAVAYEYVYGIGLVAGLLSFVQRPTRGGFWVLCLCAGLAGLVRPPALAYGGAAVLVAGVIWFLRKPLERSLKEVLLGGGLFCAGITALAVTNWVRFGSPGEFGHGLNLSDLHESMFITRMENPCRETPLGALLWELVGCVFRITEFNGSSFYSQSAVPGQCGAFRFREFYFTAYDWSVAGLAVVGWGAAVWALCRRLRGRAVGAGEVSPGMVAGLWSLVAMGPLVVFFVRYPVVTSRYVMDLAPAFAAALAGLVLLAGEWAARRWRGALAGQVIVYVAVVGWVGWELQASRIAAAYALRQPRTYEQTMGARRRMGPVFTLPEKFALGDDLRAFGFPYLGTGWDWRTGETRPVVVVFFNEPERLVVEVAGRVGGRELTRADLARVRAKVGGEFLRKAFEVKTEEGWRIQFHPPRRAALRKGTQVVFLSFTHSTGLRTSPTPVRLLEVRNEHPSQPDSK